MSSHTVKQVLILSPFHRRTGGTISHYYNASCPERAACIVMCLLVLFFINGYSIDVLLNLDYAWFVVLVT
ncbi:hypothetical protein Hanom_Chr04g00343651 [Helianthus anomalus]